MLSNMLLFSKNTFFEAKVKSRLKCTSADDVSSYLLRLAIERKTLTYI